MLGAKKERFIPLKANAGTFTNQKGEEIKFGYCEAILVDSSGYPTRVLKLQIPKNDKVMAEQLNEAYAGKKYCNAEVEVSYADGKNNTTVATFSIEKFDIEK